MSHKSSFGEQTIQEHKKETRKNLKEKTPMNKGAFWFLIVIFGLILLLLTIVFILALFGNFQLLGFKKYERIDKKTREGILGIVWLGMSVPAIIVGVTAGKYKPE